MIKTPPLAVHANPWHAPLDHNHRANSAYPWDPTDNPQRGWVGALARCDADGDNYFEFQQYEGTHGIALTLRADHAPVLVPDTLHYRIGIKSGQIWASNEETYEAIFGRREGFRPVEELAAEHAAGAVTRHEFMTGKKPTPQPRPAVGEGRVGHAHAMRASDDKRPTVSATQPIPAGTKDVPRAAAALLQKAVSETAKSIAPNPSSTGGQ